MAQPPIDAAAKAALAFAQEAALRYRMDIGSRPQRPERDCTTLRAAAGWPTPEEGAAPDAAIAALIDLATDPT